MAFDRRPLYVVIMESVQNYISDRGLKPGEQIPSEVELMNQFQVSRATVRQAMQELENEGIIEKKHGLGTFVAEPKVSIEMNGFFSFNEEAKKLNQTPHTLITQFERMRCPSKKIQQRLSLSSQEEVIMIQWLRLIDEDPVLLETTYLPGKRFLYLHQEELENQSLYDVFSHSGIRMVHGKEKYRPYLPNEEEQRLLDLEDNVPTFRFSRLLFEKDTPVEYTVSVLKSGKIALEAVIEKKIS
ncbi:UTRA domain-containing protein [Clostridiaceae bacterium DONG20-135]|uniref:UTRA domain-containing protein n=1 Tax=Copranaerobaculum intestinale TaxID=2692629 RepID=A0A6N8U5A3_9FIRM|nr:GntR family transcriptional regulator [Copranaerobaculum intestinale]MXQ73252.1 UTRA domain-containing protein [Copranaerobaculum intestinale]